ncbi:MAG: hypothetical protein BGP10_12250 [Rhodanobacter sp. 68-29]|nr:MAG: hypothetical protein ABT19_00170 [Rhodanobacter sp. SCN 68-63]OJY60663.1 MAG: hypothetical protein BGP10_12250 [Rhodanobacter sp. 68-29]
MSQRNSVTAKKSSALERDRRISLRFEDVGLKAKLEQLARAEKRTLSAQCELQLARYVEEALFRAA